MKFTKNDTNAMKGIAILILFFHHCFVTKSRWATVTYEQLKTTKNLKYFPISFAPFSEHTIVYIAGFSKICVAIFVFLTGYGLYVSYQNKKGYEDNGKFVWNRLITMMTGFWFLFLCVQILASFTGRFSTVYGKGIASLVYFLFDGLGIAKILNAPMFCLTWWYMSLAIVLVLIFPMIYRWMEKDVWIVLILVIAIPRAIGVSSDSFLRYFLAYAMGMYVAKKNLLVELKQYMLKGEKSIKLLKLIGAFLFLLVLAKCRENPIVGMRYIDIWDGICSTYIVFLSYTYIMEIPRLYVWFQVLGKHSMNMFLLHSFYRDVFFHSFTYSFRNWFVILIVLLVISFVSSWMIELLKKLFRYQLFVEYLKKKIILRG